MRSLVVVVCCLAWVSQGAEIGKVVDAKAAFKDEAHEDQPALRGGKRDEKLFSVFQIVKFNNEACTASDGNTGVCFTANECTAKGGVATGTCAEGFGQCCVFNANTCGSEVAQNVQYIQSPNYPAGAPTGDCKFTVAKCDTGVCQYKIDFEDVVLSQPAMGDCTNDTLMIMNLDGVSTKTVPSPLCGTLTGSSIYVTVNQTTAKPMFMFTTTSSDARWKIKITQLQCTDTANLADAGCLFWETATAGTLMSFNNMNGAGEHLNNMMYSHCIKYQPGFCDVSLVASDFMLGTATGATDSITFGTLSSSGSSFGTSNTLNWNFTGPYVVPVVTDGTNVEMDSGYSISYLLLPC